MRKRRTNDEILLDTDPDLIDKEYKVFRAKKMKQEERLKYEQAEIERIKKEKLQSSLIPMKEAMEIFTQAGSFTKLRLNRLLEELPPKLAGLKSGEMVEVLRDAFDEICSDIYTEFKVKEIDPNSIQLLDDNSDTEE